MYIQFNNKLTKFRRLEPTNPQGKPLINKQLINIQKFREKNPARIYTAVWLRTKLTTNIEFYNLVLLAIVCYVFSESIFTCRVRWQINIIFTCVRNQ